MIDVNMTLLLDIYGELLTEKQKLCMELFYNDDYSLTEIAQHLEISRQGVHENIKQGTEKIQKLENVLKIKENRSRIEKLCNEAKASISKKDFTSATEIINEINEIF